MEMNGNEEPLWYRFKNTRLTHMTRIESFSYSKVPIGGYKGIVNATSENWGASWRLIVELGDEIDWVMKLKPGEYIRGDRAEILAA
jgi:hypothetical protein